MHGAAVKKAGRPKGGGAKSGAWRCKADSAASATVVEARCPAPASACFSAPTINPAHQAGIAEPHFGLGGMDIDVDKGGIAVEEQRQRRMAVARQEIGIGAAHRPHQQLVPHRPAIDEEDTASGHWRGCRWGPA